jgi:hypothetical protein
MSEQNEDDNALLRAFVKTVDACTRRDTSGLWLPISENGRLSDARAALDESGVMTR